MDSREQLNNKNLIYATHTLNGKSNKVTNKIIYKK